MYIELFELLKKNIVYNVFISFVVRNLRVGIELKLKILKKKKWYGINIYLVENLINFKN